MRKKTNNYIIFGLLALLFFGFSSCNKQEELITDKEVVTDNIVEPTEEPVTDNSFKINNNFSDLNKRLKLIQEPIVNDNSFKLADIGGDCFDYTWYFVAEVDAPYLVEGEPLSATDVRILGNRAYVSYNRQGGDYMGAIEIIDITDPGFPTLISSMLFTDTDINTLAIDDTGSDEGDRTIWLAGSSFKKGAVLRQVTATNGYLNNDVVDVPLSRAFWDGRITPSANGIAYSNDFIYMTAGNSVGGTFQLDRHTLDIINHEDYSDAKAIALNGPFDGDYQLSLVAGDNAKLNVHKVGFDRTLYNSWDLGQIIHQNVDSPYLGKATVSIRSGETVAFIAMNSLGMKAIDITNGSEIYYSPSDMLTTGNTHGLAIDDKFIYMANSDDGLFIGCIPEGGGEIEKVQHWDLDEVGASANMVQTDGDWVFVAKGGGGLKILRKIKNSIIPPSTCEWDENGAPTCKNNPENLCENLLPDLKALLPEYQNAIVNQAQLFDASKRKELLLNATADVSVTFVSEGAGFKNTLGYYTYNVNNPPQSIEDIQSSMRIIFANASAQGSGGALNEGDQLYLDTFEAGTVIGFFIIANGWNGSEVTEGLYTFYTNPEFNRDNTQQTIMMFSESCSTLLTTFEDVHISGGDKDFNDLIIKTSITPMSAMNTTNLVELPSAK